MINYELSFHLNLLKIIIYNVNLLSNLLKYVNNKIIRVQYILQQHLKCNHLSNKMYTAHV